MKYAMALACLGTLLSTPALAGSSHGHTTVTPTMAFNTQDGRAGGDRDELRRLLDDEVRGVLHNPHCDPDDRDGPDGDRDDHAANNPGRGRHEGRCHNLGHPASP
ncbi:MAG TPA: hypothetical protein VHS81_09690 [Caulobacteraceae bacterium]|jgi:hypothetical protein|nr:hypothetical protein [Caulobacteraceae bacterium]